MSGTFEYLKIEINVVPNGEQSLPNGKDGEMNSTEAKRINIFNNEHLAGTSL